MEVVLHSFNTMSEELLLGYSWEAYSIWKQHWDDVLKENKLLIAEYLSERGVDAPFYNV